MRARLVDRPEDWPWSSYHGYRRAWAGRPWMTYGRVLGEFGRQAAVARRRYRQFVQAGLATPPRNPWADALAGLVVGSRAFARRVRRLLGDRPPNEDVPQLAMLRPRPTLERIVAVVAEHFGYDQGWSAGSRSDDAGRAMAAYLARRRFGYPARAIAAALGYRGHSSVSMAAARRSSVPQRNWSNDSLLTIDGSTPGLPLTACPEVFPGLSGGGYG